MMVQPSAQVIPPATDAAGVGQASTELAGMVQTARLLEAQALATAQLGVVLIPA